MSKRLIDEYDDFAHDVQTVTSTDDSEVGCLLMLDQARLASALNVPGFACQTFRELE